MGRPHPRETIDAIADRVAAGESNATIGTAMGIGRSALSGIISRLRERGDKRVPPAQKTSYFRTAYEERDAVADAFAAGASDWAEVSRITGLTAVLAHKRWAEVCSLLGRQAT